MKNSESKDARDCLLPMGTTSEAVAEKYKIPRERQDEFALASHQKAKAAQDDGRLAEEIVPIKVRKVTPAEGDKPETTEEVVISKDEGIRPQTTMESLAKLKTVFKENGTGTAGNSSQISDGASAVTLCRRDVAEKLGLKVLAKWVGSVVVGVPPVIMGEEDCDLTITSEHAPDRLSGNRCRSGLRGPASARALRHHQERRRHL